MDVITKCVSTISMQLLWNGDLTESFKSSRGLRQGCPLLPYLFVLCMERLARGIEHAVRVGKWNPFMFGKNGPSLTHLFLQTISYFLGRLMLERLRPSQMY